MQEPGKKGAVWVGIIAVHGVVLFALTSLRPPKRATVDAFESVLFFVEPRKQKTPDPAQPLTRKKTTHPLRRTAKAMPPDTAITIPASPAKSVDWDSERARVSGDIAAGEVAKSQESREFSKPKTIELPQQRSKQRTGTSQRLGFGEIITWISEDCYVTNLPPATPRLDPNSLNVQCKNRKKPTRDDLFDHLIPKYLREPGAEVPKMPDVPP
jgi:hypothetical protein